ncbi:hypothetical protein PROFUN_08569 [Planoprotostelium fungivorum]|uniref:Homeobox domain-containing protein n=1 Tax=Planoprotostelium fungivorum TaxID=1890364 RepID=A0A2P6N1S9_9EUKA|nr:hypothetical protein PROFUN_08569 [Planoprotostelium fungivorum]
MSFFPLEAKLRGVESCRAQLCNPPALSSIESFRDCHSFSLRKRGPSQDGRRKGNLTTPDQVSMLETAFRESVKPNNDEYVQLSKKVKMSEHRIKEEKSPEKNSFYFSIPERAVKGEDVPPATRSPNNVHNEDKMKISFIINTETISP